MSYGIKWACIKIQHTSKSLFGTSQDNGTHVGISIILGHSFVDFSEQIIAQGIQGLGAVKSDQTNIATSFSENVLVFWYMGEWVSGRVKYMCVCVYLRWRTLALLKARTGVCAERGLTMRGLMTFLNILNKKEERKRRENKIQGRQVSKIKAVHRPWESAFKLIFYGDT